MKNKGYILVVTLITITAIFFFAIIFTRFFVNERQLSQEKEHSMVAAAAAEAGIDEAIYQIKLDKTWTSGFSKSLPNSKAQYSITFATGQEPYSTNNSGNSSSVIGYEGRVVPAYSIHLVCKGKYGNQSNIQQAIVSAGSESPYKNTALFASRYIGLQTYYTNNSEILIDSFNSALGPYGNSRENSGGNITTNQSVFGSLKGIYMLVIYYGSISRGEINVQGTVNYGPGGVESDIIRKVGYTANISYSNANEMSEIIQAPSPSSETPGNTDIYVGSGTFNLPPGKYRNIVVYNNGNLRLSAGKYVIANIWIMNNGSVHIPPTVSSPVEFYVTNQLYIINNGKIDNQTNIPRYLTVYGSSISPDTNGSLYNGLFYIFNSGTNNIYWNLYAPNSYVYIENTDIYGAIISHIINIYSNGERVGIHFDKDLNNYLPSGIGLTSGGVVVKSRW